MIPAVAKGPTISIGNGTSVDEIEQNMLVGLWLAAPATDCWCCLVVPGRAGDDIALWCLIGWADSSAFLMFDWAGLTYIG